MGKHGQVGTVEEVAEMCAIDKRFIPTLDFGHINAYTLGGLKTKEDFVEDLKVNSFVQSVYSTNEMAEMLGQVDVIETAQNIKEEIEFEVPQNLVDRIAKSFDTTASELIMG